MSNRRAGQNQAPHSSVDKAGVGATVLELYAKGNTYSEIVRTLWEKHSVRISKMAVSRYVARDRKDITPNTAYSSIETIRDTIIQKNNNTFEEFERIFTEIGNLIDLSKLSSQEKSNIHKALGIRRKQIMNIFISEKCDIGLLFESIIKNEQGISELLIEFSDNLCSQCRSDVSKIIEEYETKK
jgi:predicted transcriptional regulator